jgi:hypothetical protein
MSENQSLQIINLRTASELVAIRYHTRYVDSDLAYWQ